MSLPLAKLPPLDLLRGFVAVGRRMSFTLAAQDLFLTQSAVSRQVLLLEQYMQTPLLQRHHRSISFTPMGERLFRSADAALLQLQDSLGELRAAQAARPVTITASIGMTGLWLLPRLSRLQQQVPGVDVRVAASDSTIDLRHEGIDLALRYTRRVHAPADAIRLFGESVAPVAHPLLLKNGKLPADATLLEFDQANPHLRWKSWLDHESLGKAGKIGKLGTISKKARMLRLNQYDMVIQAALAGQGVALGRLELIAPQLEGGQLVLLADPRTQGDDGYAYWLIQAEPSPRREVQLIANWICAQARAGRSLIG
ncbi:LysR family transcriptional regulator [Herbaspirillum seropedicae]|uniref:LysR family transcription regulator protein n=1 Tax=Herbaspirillum seropedicae (strain SmR1) TaxID=757424 RepID=D8INW9_HERSS|nr:LysR family transcriptional regulator [Herbaspirillum seropedicae]ADJ62789.1 LysR family transcription regulator protein [Herbaspirillum seropedicae SmR1]AKN64890.1 LysR family transcriptional regulator [Herbaspirillum seropedicae]NQE31304.1 LysR family transcriptional regulator [Herbaspirillum seropedicae]UMU20833.1 LysR family transcriptional regulator [Herbaspirillum seropedicae]